MTDARVGIEVVGPAEERYRLQDYLGHGAFGETYRAVGTTSGRVVAVKLLPVNELQDEASRTALLNEAELATKIDHPNVVRMLHVERGTSSELGPYVVMEYVSGGTLSTRLRTQSVAKAPIPLEEALRMMLDIAQGGRAINERLVHRDIKPDNILIEGTHLKIGDFGISKVIDERTRQHTFKGAQHIHYMAPEGWEGEPNTYKLDVYSVGLVYYEILTLSHPLTKFVKQEDWKDWRRAHLFEKCPDVRTIRAEVDVAASQLLSRMVAKRPIERPEWDEIVARLSPSRTPPDETAGRASRSSLRPVLEAALKKQEEMLRKQLEAQEAAERSTQKAELYRHVCSELATAFDEVVAEFNVQYQHGQIIIEAHGGGNREYHLPTGVAISVGFFPPRETDIRVQNRQLIGGGFLGIRSGPSANLLLVRESGDDLYGRWIGCLVSPMALVHPSKLLGYRGITRDTVIPFGFRAAEDFYEEMRFVHMMHVFKYDIIDDTKHLFSEMLETAFQGPPERPRP